MALNDLKEIKVPSLGESIREATVSKWTKSIGDFVKGDELLVELETDKVTVEVSAPTSGFVKEIRAAQGSTVLVGDILGFLEPGVAPVKTEEKKEANKSSSFVPQEIPKFSQSLSTPKMSENLSPSVRKLSEERRIDIQSIAGTGKAGRVTKGDILGLTENVPPTQKVIEETPLLPEQRSHRISDRREERVKMTRLRQRIAERLKQAQNTSAILTTFNEVDMSFVNTLRHKYRDQFEKKHGVRLGMMSFFVKACIQALKEFPAVNAEIEGDEIIYKNYYDIGVAVSIPQGLVVPVLRDADQLSFADVERTIGSLAQKAKDGKLTIEEMTGGTFTISNGGIFGSLLSTPVLNPPQAGILGMHKIEDRPVVIEGKIEIRPMMYLALSYDHRLIDGRESVTFLVRVKENLENPERLLLDM